MIPLWIDYFKSGENSARLDDLLEDNQIVINDIILAELEPFLIIKKQYKIIEMLHRVRWVEERNPTFTIHATSNEAIRLI